MSSGYPWWFSGPQTAHDSQDAPDAADRGGFSLSFLASGAQQLVDLAKQAILVPHVDHVDPSEHGECIICRGLLALDEVRGRPNGGSSDSPAPAGRTGSVRWIDLDPGQPDAPAGDGRPDHRLSP